jgi:hypothetical protein
MSNIIRDLVKSTDKVCFDALEEFKSAVQDELDWLKEIAEDIFE